MGSPWVQVQFFLAKKENVLCLRLTGGLEPHARYAGYSIHKLAFLALLKGQHIISLERDSQISPDVVWICVSLEERETGKDK